MLKCSKEPLYMGHRSNHVSYQIAPVFSKKEIIIHKLYMNNFVPIFCRHSFLSPPKHHAVWGNYYKNCSFPDNSSI